MVSFCSKEQQNEEDAELYEQHLLGGLCCPLCGLGRLDIEQAEETVVLCSKCPLRVALMDEQMGLEELEELLCMAEQRHQKCGCSTRGKFQSDTWGPWGHQLHYACDTCGWKELVFWCLRLGFWGLRGHQQPNCMSNRIMTLTYDRNSDEMAQFCQESDSSER